MKLLTKELETKLPALYENEEIGLDALAVVKFFNPVGAWTWYASEYDPKEKIFFGLVDGFEKELGYFSLEELESLELPMGLKIERDLYFNPTPLKDLM
jgi:hypothetical protein